MNAGFDNGDDLLGAGSFRFMLNRKLTYKLADLLPCLLSRCGYRVTRWTAVGTLDGRQRLALTAATGEVARDEFAFRIGLAVARIAQLAGCCEQFSVTRAIRSTGCQVAFSAWRQRVMSVSIQCHHFQPIKTRWL